MALFASLLFPTEQLFNLSSHPQIYFRVEMALISVPRFEQTICLPAEFGGSIRHVFKNPLSATADEDDPNSVTTELSPPLKMGPLEFRIEAGIVTGPDLSFFLQCMRSYTCM